MTGQPKRWHNQPMGTDNTATKRRSPMSTATTTDTREWRVVVRKPRANRFRPMHFEGTWAEAERFADAIAALTDLEVFYVHESDAEVLTDRGSRVAIKGYSISREELLEPCTHSCDALEGYRVTIANPTVTGITTSIAYRAHEYGLAIAKADEALSRGRQARVSRLYSCGHWSEDI